MESLWLSFGFAASNAVFSPIAYWFIDGKGRRFLLLASLTAMVPLLLATAFSFKLQEATAKHAVVEVFVVLYTAAYSPGAGVVPFLYSSEVFPLINREAGMSLSCSVNFMLAGLLALTVPQLNHALGPTRLLGLFAGLDAMAALLVWLFVPGTVQVTTLEEMNYIFGVPTDRHVQYQIRDVLPWIIRRCIPGQRAGRLIPLYTWNRQRRQEELQPWPLNGSQTQPTTDGMDEAVEPPTATIPNDDTVTSWTALRFPFPFLPIVAQLDHTSARSRGIDGTVARIARKEELSIGRPLAHLFFTEFSWWLVFLKLAYSQYLFSELYCKINQ